MRVTRDIDIDLTPKEMAEQFWEMDCEQQAKFFSELGKIISQNGGRGIQQLDYITFEGEMYPHGKNVIDHLYLSLNNK